jgi:hypothetical protein
MSDITLFQTVEDRDNVDNIERNGPILCIKNPWLGKGYYFWEMQIENAHWWGKNHYKDNYMIFEVTSSYPERILDLVNNYEHLSRFRNVINYLRKVYPKKKINVAFAIEFLKKENLLSDFMAIKANAINSKSYNNVNKSQVVPFLKNTNQFFLELVPPIQVCVFNKNMLNNDFHVIYPDKYCLDQDDQFVF